MKHTYDIYDRDRHVKRVEAVSANAAIELYLAMTGRPLTAWPWLTAVRRGKI